jgi:hypothetical protein
VVYSAFVQKLIPEAEEKFLESRAWSVLKAGKLSAICEAIF